MEARRRDVGIVVVTTMQISAQRVVAKSATSMAAAKAKVESTVLEGHRALSCRLKKQNFSVLRPTLTNGFLGGRPNEPLGHQRIHNG